MSEKDNFNEYRLLILNNFKKLFSEVEKQSEEIENLKIQLIEQKTKVGIIGASFGIIASVIVGLLIKYISS